MTTRKPDTVRHTRQVDDNQDDLGRDVNDTSADGAPRHPQTRNDEQPRRRLSGDALKDGSQH